MLSTAILATSLLAGPALARDAGGYGYGYGYPYPPPPPYESMTTISLNPVRFVAPMIEITGEFSLDPDSSLAIIGGFGTDPRRGAPLYTLGMQYRDYIVGSFRNGLDLGLQAKLTDAGFFGFDQHKVMLGPFMGAKISVALFTMEFQWGGQLVLRNGAPLLAPLGNFTLGVTF
jgi:hypothetical protein